MATHGEPAQLKRFVTLGVECLKRGDGAGAQVHLRRALALAPDHPDVQHFLASALGQSGQLAEARSLVDRAIARDGQRGAFFNTLGNICRAQGEQNEALRAYARALDLEPRLLAAQFNRGLILAQTGELAAAATAFDQVLALQPANFDALMQRGLIARRSADGAQAEQFFAAATRVQPTSPDAHYQRAAALYQQGDFPATLEALATAIEIAPERASVHLLQARAQRALGQLPVALATLHRALEQHRDDAGLLAELGGVLQALGRLEEAETAFESSLVNQSVPATAASLAELHLWQGDADRARDVLTGFAASDSAQVAIMQARLALNQNGARPDPAPLAAWLEGEEARALTSIERRQLAFCLGDVWHAHRDVERAFHYYTQGNALDTVGFDMAATAQYVEQSIEFFSAARFDALARTDAAAAGPVFIVGMPRSGTTLLEQMLGMHARVDALGERADIGVAYHAAVGNASLATAMAAQSTGQLNATARAYLEAQSYAPDARWITDKMPLNFLYLGYIAMLFPQARVVHCQRSPEAIALSCFRQDFTDPALGFSRDLDTLGQFMAEHDRLMRHWCEVLPLPIARVAYEDLVEDAAGEIARLLQWLELEYDPRCLEFERADRFVNTASHAQVRRGLYRNALGRHERYADALAPFTLSYARSSERSVR